MTWTGNVRSVQLEDIKKRLDMWQTVYCLPLTHLWILVKTSHTEGSKDRQLNSTISKHGLRLLSNQNWKGLDIQESKLLLKLCQYKNLK